MVCIGSGFVHGDQLGGGHAPGCDSNIIIDGRTYET